ncbi:MAG: hypothetical protein U0414_35730 [Polyangiaceae bacterium]
MRFRLGLLGCAVLVVAACDSEVTIETTGAATTGSGSSTGHASSTSGSTSGGFSTSSSSTGVGGAPPSICEPGFIAVDLGDGSKEELTSICPNGWGSQFSKGPVAYFFSAGAFAGNFILEGCGGSGSVPQILVSAYQTDTEVPSLSIGDVSKWVDPSGTVWEGADDGQVQTWTMSTKVGDSIEGTFAGTVKSPSGMLKSISGTFRACKVENENLP